MGNLEKSSKGAVSKVLEEIGRVDDSVKFNEEKHTIDYSKTHLNYSVIAGINGYDDMMARFENRMSQLKCMNRDDVKVLGKWVWQAPSDLPRDQIKPLFREITRFFAQKHGIENIAYAQVHLDETTPHLHLGIIPTVPIKDPKEGQPKEKIRSKDVFTPMYLKSVHTDLQEFVSEELGFEVNLLNGASLGIDGIVNYKKAKDLAKSVNKLEIGLQERETLIESLDKEIRAKEAHLKDLNSKIASSETELEEKTGELVNIRTEITESKSILEKMREAIGEISEFLKGSPNLLVQFYRWCTNWKKDKEHAKQVVEDYTSEMKVNLERIDNLLVPDSAPKAPSKTQTLSR